MYAYRRCSDLFFSEEEIASWPEGHKCCKKCRRVLPFSSFHRHRQCLFGYNTVCKRCRVPLSAEHYDESSIEYRLWYRARRRARVKGLSFTIKLSDIHVPDVCPVFGVPMLVGGPYAPSLDRVDSSLGYDKDNILVMSSRANTLKGDATVPEVLAILRFLRKHT